MKVAIECNILANRHTGVEYYTINLIKNLMKHIKVTLIHNKSVEHPIFKKSDEFLLDRPWKFPLSRTFYAIFSPLKVDADILHCPQPATPFFRKPKNKLVITIHDITPIFMPRFHTLRRIVFFKVFLGYTLRMADKIIAVSECTKNDLIKYMKIPEDKISVIYEGKDDMFKPVDKKNPKKYNIPKDYILYLGTVEPRKNLINLIKAYGKLKPKEKLVIVGCKGWKYSEIFKTTEELGIEKDIIFTDYADSEDLPAIYSNAKLFVYPSLYEGFGLPILEAMACGTPVITSDVSSMPEVAGKAGILIDPSNSDSIADAMHKVLSDEKLQKEMSKKGIEQAKKFSWDKCAKETIKIYEELHEDSPHRQVLLSTCRRN